jgi:hypothetical protein
VLKIACYVIIVLFIFVATSKTKKIKQQKILLKITLDSNKILTTMALFECTKCEKAYKSRGSLTNHQRMHKGTAFACDLCEKRFDRKGNFEKHRVAHTFTKAYACDVDGCEQKYTQKNGLL